MMLCIDNRSYNINILNIAKDGNCLFASLAHQLEYHKINSMNHNSFTASLRRKVVDHITQNFDQYKHLLELRFDATNNKQDGLEFVSTNLCNQGAWGGTETILAVSNMFKVNIIIFNERGSFYFATGYNSKYERSIFLAYRIGSQSKDGKFEYNHYDSVCEINESLLYKCVKDLGGKLDKQFDSFLE